MNISYYFRVSCSWATIRCASLLISLALGVFWPTSEATAKIPSKLSPAKIKQIKQSNKSFKECQKTALQDFKGQKTTQPGLKQALESCKERYPGAGLYIACKKKVLLASKSSKSKKTAADPLEELAECKQYLTAAAFDPDASVPFFHENGQLFFAGIGLNKATTLKTLNPPNFDCERLSTAMKKPSEASYILFGNHPRMFGASKELSTDNLTNLYKVTSKQARKEARNKDGYLIPGIGRIYGTPSDESSAIFFPSAPCDFDGQTGSIFAGLSVYFLQETDAQVSPYFGIAYFKAGQQAVKTVDLIAQATTKLGSNFRSFKKNGQVVFLASSPIAEVDSEKDPRNLCRSPRKHEVMVVIQSLKDNPRQPEYLIVANVKNLCDYGDRLARRLAK